jgi:hypothetical protein
VFAQEKKKIEVCRGTRRGRRGVAARPAGIRPTLRKRAMETGAFMAR